MRIGILGVAHPHVTNYISNLRIRDAEVVGAYDWDGKRGANWADRHCIPFEPEASALLREGLDGVLVCSETAFHAELVETAAAAGVAILCEKPLGLRRDDTERMVRACERSGASLMTAFPMRFHPAVRRVREVVEAGGLGTLRALTGNNQGIMPAHEGSWFADPELAGGGAIMDHIVHLADIFCWLTQSVPETVYSVSNRVIHADVVNVETGGLMTMTFSNGVFASIDCSWSRPPNYPAWGEAAFFVVGDTGTAEVDVTTQRLTQYGGSSAVAWLPWGPSINQSMIDEFLLSMSEGRAPSVTGWDGAVATAVAVSAMESAASGEVVQVLWPRRAGHSVNEIYKGGRL